MSISQLLDNAKNLHSNIANDVWPNGWSGECHTCGKPFSYTREQCAYYLAHGWPKCDHQYDGEPPERRSPISHPRPTNQ